MKHTTDADHYFTAWIPRGAATARYDIMTGGEIIVEAISVAELGDDWTRYPFEDACDCADKGACAGHSRDITVDAAVDYLTTAVDDGDVRGYLPLEVARREGIRASRYGRTAEMSAAEVREATAWFGGVA